MLTFSIAQWQGWAQGIDSPADWLQWAEHPYCPLGEQRAPRLDFLPPMQRRRLSPLARAVFECAWPLAAERPAMPLVFASRHGETTRNFGLLQALATDEPLSPTAFGLSVHNAIAAQWSIIRRETTESIALSVEDDGLEHAFLEAAMLFGEGHEDVLVVLAEERPPAPYAPWIDDAPYTYAAAFHLRPGTDWTGGPGSSLGGTSPAEVLIVFARECAFSTIFRTELLATTTEIWAQMVFVTTATGAHSCEQHREDPWTRSRLTMRSRTASTRVVRSCAPRPGPDARSLRPSRTTSRLPHGSNDRSSCLSPSRSRPTCPSLDPTATPSRSSRGQGSRLPGTVPSLGGPRR